MKNLPPWYKTAVFYEVPVYAYRDVDANGTGDFRGLEEKLDYLQWLGVSCLWILPFYESPLRDGGYDVSDFNRVLPRYGTVDEVRAFLATAHQRGLKVIADMVVNHTSDQHPWFLEARKPGSPMRDWYVWSDTDTRWSEARVIFTDTHDSNWTWDDEAGAYYWHRFFWHQPDLNFDHPPVREAMKDVVRFWLEAGFDGLRLDAVPYLYERDGTNGENLPETHAYLKELRAMVDEEFPNAVLLSEANQWPRDVVEYFGDGDECHMAFHFPVMPRLFMALEQGTATSIIDILADTPPIPENAQWGMFLRNHDELTLEMVSEDERAFMYERYAPDPTMRKNLGIRRRLAPLLGNDRRKIELLHAVLLSLPGSPILYYGDEIGMGDLHELEDRDGVRTPMQWDASPGAGFSAAEPSEFYLPLVDRAGYSPAEINVAAQRDDPASLLSWVRAMLALRARHPLFGTGTYTPVPVATDAVLAYARKDDTSRVIVAGNFSSNEVTFNVSDQDAGEILTSARGSGVNPDGTVTLGPYGFLWLSTP